MENVTVDSDLACVCVFLSVHAAVIAINEAVDRGHVEVTAEALRNPNALLSDLQEALMSIYQEMLHQAKRRKEEWAANRVRVWCVIGRRDTCLSNQKTSEMCSSVVQFSPDPSNIICPVKSCCG